ncbi:MAG: hypothetical protein ABGY41_04540 [Candidatus Poribacteria bacterium]
MDTRDTLIRLLLALQRDVDACIQHESQDFMLSKPGAGAGGQTTVADPILLGHFIVDAYNRLLTDARAISSSPFLASMPSVGPLSGDTPYDDTPHDESRPRTHGADPRLGKMAEVLLAAGQLLAVLDGEASGASEARNETVETLIVAVEALGQQVTAGPGVGGPREPAMVLEAACALAERYNAYLDLVIETCEDPIVARLFPRIDIDHARAEDAAGAGTLAALSADTTSLAAYLRKLIARSQPALGTRAKMREGDTRPVLAG